MAGENNSLRGYWLSVGIVALAGAARITLLPRAVNTAPFVFFYPAIATASLLGGAGAGIAAVALSALVAIATAPGSPSIGHWVIFVVVGPALVWAFSRLKRLRDRSAVLSTEALQLRFIVDRASDWILLVSENNAIEYINQTACTSLGYAAGELIGKNIEVLVGEAQRADFMGLLDQCQKGPVPLAESVWRRRDGSGVTVEVGCTAISVQDQRVVHVAARDIAERKAIEKKLQEARQWEGLGSLAGGVAHDFNNLLTSIMGNASLARESLPAGHPVIGMLESIEAAGDRSAELVRMMLATSGYKPRYLESVRIDEMLNRVLREQPLPVGVSASVSAEPAIVESDRRSVETLLASLVSNAAEAYDGQPGEITIRIEPQTIGIQTTASARQQTFEDGEMPGGSCSYIDVRDQGCGMAPEVLERAFDPFFTTKFTGRGLGLPAVRGIVRAHRGRLVLSTHPGQGTRVEVWLPVSGARYDVSAPE